MARTLAPAVAAARARKAGLRRHRPADDPEVMAAGADLRAALAEQYITRLLDETPPLSEEDRAHLARLLTDPRSEAPTAPDAA